VCVSGRILSLQVGNGRVFGSGGFRFIGLGRYFCDVLLGDEFVTCPLFATAWSHHDKASTLLSGFSLLSNIKYGKGRNSGVPERMQSISGKPFTCDSSRFFFDTIILANFAFAERTEVTQPGPTPPRCGALFVRV